MTARGVGAAGCFDSAIFFPTVALFPSFHSFSFPPFFPSLSPFLFIRPTGGMR